MKQRLFMLFALCMLCISYTTAQPKHLSREEFNKKFQAFIIENAKLTEKEALEFFPIYNECQKKKNELNGEIWKLLRKETQERQKLSEVEYQKMLEEIAELRIKIEKLEKDYIQRYHKVLPYSKIFDVNEAETRFNRELVRKTNYRNNRNNKNK